MIHGTEGKSRMAPANDRGTDMSKSYVDRVLAIPMLTLEEEQRLTRAWRDDKDEKARIRIISAHLRLTVRSAMTYRNYGIPMDDLMDEGAIGIGKALDRFDPDRGFRFSTYAMWWVRAEVIDHILRTSRLVKMGTTSDGKKLFFNLRRQRAMVGGYGDVGLTDEQAAKIAENTGTSIGSVIEMDRRLAPDSSLNAVEATTGREYIDTLVSQDPLQDEAFCADQERNIREAMLRKAVECLKPRDRRIIEGRRLSDPPLTLQVLADEYGVSRERIRQLEVKAYDRLQRRVVELARMRRYLPLAA